MQQKLKLIANKMAIYTKQKIARATGIPMSKQGLERKIGNTILKGAKKLIK